MDCVDSGPFNPETSCAVLCMAGALDVITATYDVHWNQVSGSIATLTGVGPDEIAPREVA